MARATIAGGEQPLQEGGSAGGVRQGSDRSLVVDGHDLRRWCMSHGMCASGGRTRLLRVWGSCLCMRNTFMWEHWHVVCAAVARQRPLSNTAPTSELWSTIVSGGATGAHLLKAALLRGSSSTSPSARTSHAVLQRGEATQHAAMSDPAAAHPRRPSSGAPGSSC